MGQLDGKTALILGAAGKGNMAQTIARHFAREGAQLMLAGRNEQALKTLSDEISQTTPNHRPAFALCDITQAAQLNELAEKTIATYGSIDIALNATGKGFVKKFEAITENELDEILAVQFKGVFFFLQAMLAKMKEKGGAIIQISSVTTTLLVENYSAYMGTKAGIDHVIRNVANEYGRYNIRVNSISPGFTVTPMTEHAANMPGLTEAFAKEIPLGRIGTSEDIAAAAVFLASDECFMTGQNLQINGGITLRRNPTQAEITAAIAAAKNKS